MARFFDTNYLFENFGGTVDASSATAIASLAFDEDTAFAWTSDGEGTDGDAIYLERVLTTAATVNRIFVRQTNISDLTIQVDIGAGYVSLATATAFTLTKSNDGTNYFYELDNSIAIDSIKFEGEDTITANEEKTIGQAYAFMELGVLANNDDIKPKRDRVQVITKLNSGKVDVVTKGRTWSFKLKLKSHYNESDNDIIDTVLQRDSEMWLWINDDQEDSMKMVQEPFRFQDLYKVEFQKGDSMRFNKNMFFSGVNVDFNLIEVA
jgi:hypothetical protein